MKKLASLAFAFLLLAGCGTGNGGENATTPEGVTIEGDTARAKQTVIYAKGVDGEWTVEVDSSAMEKQDRWLKKRGFNYYRVKLSARARDFVSKYRGADSEPPKSYYKFKGAGIYVKADTSQAATPATAE
jgi:hypothetical protein